MKIDAILKEIDIHHNISTLNMKLPMPPDDCPDDIFWDTCEMIVSNFKKDWKDWKNNPINDTGNRNIGKDCELKGEIWQHGRMGATLYWDRYWKSTNSGFCFIYSKEELEDMDMEELMEINDDLREFNRAVKGMMKTLPDELTYRYNEWKEQNEETKRRKALGYYKTLEELLNSDNPTVKRHAKGILNALQK